VNINGGLEISALPGDSSGEEDMVESCESVKGRQKNDSGTSRDWDE
jgi:hypothetical protein